MSQKKQLFNRKPRTQTTTDVKTPSVKTPSVDERAERVGDIDLGDGTVLAPVETDTSPTDTTEHAPSRPVTGRRGRPSIPTSFTIVSGPAKKFVVHGETYKVGETVNITRAQILTVAYKAVAAGFSVTLGPVSDSEVSDSEQ